MRVITGSARGRKLITVEGTELVRPTTDRVKEAIFSAIQFDIEGAVVLDLFAGSEIYRKVTNRKYAVFGFFEINKRDIRYSVS